MSVMKYLHFYFMINLLRLNKLWNQMIISLDHEIIHGTL